MKVARVMYIAPRYILHSRYTRIKILCTSHVFPNLFDLYLPIHYAIFYGSRIRMAEQQLYCVAAASP